MAKFPPLWNQALSYPAQVDRYLLGSLWPGGGASGAVPTVVANTMNVSIPPGSCAVPLQAGQGTALCHWDAAEVVTIVAAPPSGQSRWDLIVCQVRDNAIDGGPNNDFVLAAVAGTPAASPAPPANPANAYAMAWVLVSGGAANLNGATIVDLRANGLAVPPGAQDTQGAEVVMTFSGGGNASYKWPRPFGSAPAVSAHGVGDGVNVYPPLDFLIWGSYTTDIFLVAFYNNATWNGAAKVSLIGTGKAAGPGALAVARPADIPDTWPGHERPPEWAEYVAEIDRVNALESEEP